MQEIIDLKNLSTLIQISHFVQWNICWQGSLIWLSNSCYVCFCAFFFCVKCLQMQIRKPADVICKAELQESRECI